MVDVFWQVIAPILLAASLGYVLARRVGLSARQLSRAGFYLFSPCLLFDKLSHTSLSADDLQQLAVAAVLTMTGTALTAWLVCRVVRYTPKQTSAFILVAFAGNTGNYGLPANQFAFGPPALEPAVVYYTISTIALSTLGVYLAASGQHSAMAAARNVLRVPLIYAGLAGLLVWYTGVTIPTPIDRAVRLLGEGAVPVMLALLGAQLADVHLRSDLTRISLASAIKLVVSPLFGMVVAGLVGLAGISRQSVILQTAMPTAVMTTVLAGEYNAEPQFTAGTVLVSTLASLVTVTLVLTFLR